MWTVEGIPFKTKSEYEDALADKIIIDDLRTSFDLSNANDIEIVYRQLQTVRFKTIVGNKFDDYIFDLHEKVKKGEITSADTINKSVSKADKNKRKGKSVQIKSIDDYDPAIRAKIKAEIKRRNKNRIILIVILMLFAFSSLGYYGFYYKKAADVDRNSDILSQLIDTKFADILNVTPVVKKDYDDSVVIPDILDEYVALYNRNKNFIGWLKIEGMIIDYPVMQSNDNTYYLKHNFDGKDDKNGCIFMDYKNDIILGNTNYILYGHHMKSGKMFATLIKYANQDFYEQHKIINFDTIYEKGTYEVMYAFRSHIYNSDEIAFKYYQFIDANSADEFDSYMEEMAGMSLINTDVTAQYGDKLLTLSTCDYQEANGRFVVVAKKIN